jgi:hypothetical protein
MNEYPSWVELVTYFGLDPITVWLEYREVLIASIVAAILALLALVYLLFVKLKVYAILYRYTFSEKTSFFRLLDNMPEDQAELILETLNGEAMVYSMYAFAAKDVPGVRRKMGILVLTATQLFFLPKGSGPNGKIPFNIENLKDANVKDAPKYVELKLILDSGKPIFHLMGVTREQAQEFFAKMGMFRTALLDKRKRLSS